MSLNFNVQIFLSPKNFKQVLLELVVVLSCQLKLSASFEASVQHEVVLFNLKKLIKLNLVDSKCLGMAVSVGGVGG